MEGNITALVRGCPRIGAGRRDGGALMSTAGFLKIVPDGVCLSLKVQPRASKNEIGDMTNAELKIKVTAPPVDAAANEALLHLLAQCLDCPRGAVQLIRGRTSRHKQVFIRGMSVEAVLDKLCPGNHA